MTLSNKTALVVGASRGIGLAIARALAREGAHTILAARSLDALTKEAEALRSEGAQAEPLKLDITDVANIELPQIDILVNVSGTNIRRPFEEYTLEEYQTVMQTNLHGFVQLTQKAGAQMIARGSGGKIIFIGSLLSILGLPYVSVYAISKSAIAGLTRTLAAEWGKYNIQVNCIAPGFILTQLNRPMWTQPAMSGWLEGVQANPKMGKPEDVAPLAVLLSGPGSDYITGQVIAVDGGYSTTAHWPFQP